LVSVLIWQVTFFYWQVKNVSLLARASGGWYELWSPVICMQFFKFISSERFQQIVLYTLLIPRYEGAKKDQRFGHNLKMFFFMSDVSGFRSPTQ